MPGFLNSICRDAGVPGAGAAKPLDSVPASVWRIPLVREIALILLIKLILLFTIKTIWFGAPTVPADGVAQVASHLLGSKPSVPILPALEETPR